MPDLLIGKLLLLCKETCSIQSLCNCNRADYSQWYPMIDFQNVSKRYGGQIVLHEVSFRINRGEHIGFVGPNGAGKSTIFDLITGEVSPDGGRVTVQADCRLGYVRQEARPHKESVSLLEYVENAVPVIEAIHAEIHEIEDQLHRNTTDNPASALKRLGYLQTRLESMGGYHLKHRAEKALCGLGFSPDSLDVPFRSLSGGWQSRAELARILVAEPEVLLLDEPSNYLDIPTIEWLQKYLKEFTGTLALISHDRHLLNSLTTITIEIANTCVERYPGKYDYYARERKLRVEQRMAAQKNQERRREQIERFIERFHAKNTKSSQVRSRVKMLEKLVEVDVPQQIVSRGRIRLRVPPHCGTEVMRLEEAGLTYDGSRWVLRKVGLSVARGDKIALVGLNGLGKTTLLRMLAGKLPLSEGRRVVGHKVIIGYQSQDFAETMDAERTVFETVKSVAPDVSEQETRNLLGGFGFSGVAIEKPVQVLSGGEKIRLAFARLLIKPPNFLVLDEPTTHLDIQARESLERALQDYQGTICLVSHDIDFVRNVANSIVAMTPPGIARYPGGYDYYHEKVSGELSVVSGKEEDASRRVTEDKKTVSEKLATDNGQLTTDRMDKKELRKQRALERQAMHDKTKDLKKAIKKAESEVERLEAEQAILVQTLSAPGETTDYAAVSRRMKEIQYEIRIATETWERSTEALERAMGAGGGQQAAE